MAILRILTEVHQIVLNFGSWIESDDEDEQLNHDKKQDIACKNNQVRDHKTLVESLESKKKKNYRDSFDLKESNLKNGGLGIRRKLTDKKNQ